MPDERRRPRGSRPVRLTIPRPLIWTLVVVLGVVVLCGAAGMIFYGNLESSTTR